MTELNRAQQAADRIADIVGSLSGNYGAGSAILAQLVILQRELAARDAQILRAVEQASNVATRTDPGRLFALEQAVEILCEVLNDRPGWKSCAHISKTVRDQCDEFDADPYVIQLISDQLGVGLEKISPAQVRKLKREDLL